jgi:hypothetical protein
MRARFTQRAARDRAARAGDCLSSISASLLVARGAAAGHDIGVKMALGRRSTALPHDQQIACGDRAQPRAAARGQLAGLIVELRHGIGPTSFQAGPRPNRTAAIIEKDAVAARTRTSGVESNEIVIGSIGGMVENSVRVAHQEKRMPPQQPEAEG